MPGEIDRILKSVPVTRADYVLVDAGPDNLGAARQQRRERAPQIIASHLQDLDELAPYLTKEPQRWLLALSRGRPEMEA